MRPAKALIRRFRNIITINMSIYDKKIDNPV